MPPCPTPARASSRREPSRAGALIAAARAAGCAAPRQPFRDLTPPEVLVEVLPRAAELSVDGRPLGRGARTVPVPDPGHRYRLRATAPGFVPAERSEDGARWAGARVGLVLRPEGFGSARPLELDDGESLAAAAGALARAGAHAAALEYAERAVEAAPQSARAQRVLGDAALAVGRRSRAIDGYSAYVRLAPSAPDRAAVMRQVEELRGDLTMPGVERR